MSTIILFNYIAVKSEKTVEKHFRNQILFREKFYYRLTFSEVKNVIAILKIITLAFEKFVKVALFRQNVYILKLTIEKQSTNTNTIILRASFIIANIDNC